MLSTFGIEHRMACHGQEAVDTMMASRNYPPNAFDTSLPLYGLVFMDISMPVLDGNAAIQIIRKANITVPIVALSANVLSQERDRTICLGADEFHTKPILRNNLLDLCERYLVERCAATASPSSSSQIEACTAPIGSKFTPLLRSQPQTTTSGDANSYSRSGSICSTVATDATESRSQLSESTSLQDLQALAGSVQRYGALNV